MQTHSTPPGQMTQGQYPLAQPQPGQAPPRTLHPAPAHSGQISQGQIPQGQIPQGQGQPGQMQQQYPQQHPEQYLNPAAPADPQHYHPGYAQTAVGQQGYRPAQSQMGLSQVSPAQVNASMTQAQAEQLQASRIQASQAQARLMQSNQLQAQQHQANQAAAQAAAIQHAPRGHLATAPAPRPRGYGPTDPTQYLQREAAAQAATQAVTNRYAQPYGHQVPHGQGTGGWTGAHQPSSHQAAHQTGMAQQPLMRGTRPRRRYRHELDEDFAPNFGQSPSPTAESWLLSLPVINWHNLPLGNMRFWTALGGIVFAAIMLNVLGTSPVISSIVKSRNRQCQEVIQPNSVLSRQQLTQLIAVPERSPKAKIHEIIQEPYCLLPSLNIRAGVNAVREAYPLEFDPDTWIVVLYEGDEYAGYRFNAR